MTPLIFATALSILAPAVAGVPAPSHHTVKFDDTRTDVILNGGDPNEVLCADRAAAGSRFTQHVCQTRAEWADLKGLQLPHTNRVTGQSNKDSTVKAGSGDANHPPGAGNPP